MEQANARRRPLHGHPRSSPRPRPARNGRHATRIERIGVELAACRHEGRAAPVAMRLATDSSGPRWSSRRATGGHAGQGKFGVWWEVTPAGDAYKGGA